MIVAAVARGEQDDVEVRGGRVVPDPPAQIRGRRAPASSSRQSPPGGACSLHERPRGLAVVRDAGVEIPASAIVRESSVGADAVVVRDQGADHAATAWRAAEDCVTRDEQETPRRRRALMT